MTIFIFRKICPSITSVVLSINNLDCWLVKYSLFAYEYGILDLSAGDLLYRLQKNKNQYPHNYLLPSYVYG